MELNEHEVAAKMYNRLCGRIAFEDLLQAARIGIWKAEKSYDPSKGVPKGAYARIRANGEMLDYVRELNGGRRPKEKVDISKVNLKTPPPEERDPYDLRKLIEEELTPTQRKVTLDYYWGEMDQDEISRNAGKSNTYASVILYQARRVLKSKLKGQLNGIRNI